MMYAFITVRTGSSRLKNKCLLPFGKGNVLEHVINRAKYFKFKPVICTTELSEDDVIVDIASNKDCFVFRGSEKDKLGRWLGACIKFDISRFHQFDADDLFLDGGLAVESLELLSNYDIVYPSPSVYVGGVGFSITRDTLERAWFNKEDDDTEMAWHFIESVPDIKSTTIYYSYNNNIRLTLDYMEDYVLLLTVLYLLGERAGVDDIETLFKNNPDMYKVNWFRNEEWKTLQEVRRYAHR